MHAPSASRNIQSGCHAPNLNPGALSRLARSVPKAHALRNGLAPGEVTLAIGENSLPAIAAVVHPGGKSGPRRWGGWCRPSVSLAQEHRYRGLGAHQVQLCCVDWDGVSCLTGC